MRYLWILLPLCFIITSCTSSTPKSTAVNQIPIYRQAIPEGISAERIGVIQATHGYGCGGFGAKGTYEGANVEMQNKADLSNADAVLITKEVPPRVVPACRDNTYYLTGELLRFNAFKYTPPVPLKLESMEFRYTLPAGFDETWASLIDAVSSQFFEVTNYEKDSGLLTLSFDADDPTEYIDCGLWKKTNPEKINTYDGKYMNWLKHVDAQSRMNTSMKINLRVRPESEASTTVEINASYKLRAPASKLNFNFMTRTQSTKYADLAPAGMDSTRICQSTLELEELLLATIKQIARKL